jgi:3-deoxy-D-manno-octulosonic-acid transferase
VTVNGNAKGDFLWRPSSETARRQRALQGLYRTSDGTPVLVAGSTRSGEEAVVYEAFRQIRNAFPGALLIVAPRHIRRARQVAQLAVETGLPCQFRTAIDADTRPRTAAVVVLDTIGELLDTYGIASVAFCGGSLVEKGGQNLLEAASWAKPVLYGPSTEDFQEARELLEALGGGICVDSASALADRFISLVSDPEMATRVGENARKALVESRGAAGRHAAVIQALLGSTNRGTP